MNPSFTKKGMVVLKSVKGNRAFFSSVAPLTSDELEKLKVISLSMLSVQSCSNNNKNLISLSRCQYVYPYNANNNIFLEFLLDMSLWMTSTFHNIIFFFSGQYMINLSLKSLVLLDRALSGKWKCITPCHYNIIKALHCQNICKDEKYL